MAQSDPPSCSAAAKKSAALTQNSKPFPCTSKGVCHKKEAQAQSERIAVLEASYAHVATKADIADVRTEIAKVRTEIADLGAELKTDIANLRTEVKTDIANLRTEVISEIGDLRTEVISEIGTLGANVNTELGTLRTDMKNMRWMIGVLMAAASIFITAANVLVSLALRT